jgi:hypothetical protein
MTALSMAPLALLLGLPLALISAIVFSLYALTKQKADVAGDEVFSRGGDVRAPR